MTSLEEVRKLLRKVGFRTSEAKDYTKSHQLRTKHEKEEFLNGQRTK